MFGNVAHRKEGIALVIVAKVVHGQKPGMLELPTNLCLDMKPSHQGAIC